MRVLLLGGGGFLSSAVERHLAAVGHELTVLSRSGRTAHPASRSVSGDRHDGRVLADLAAGDFDGIVDFLCFEASHAATLRDAFRGRGGRHVMISTGSVYWCTGEWSNPVGEDQYPQAALAELPPTGLRPGSIEYDYGRGKRQAEDLLAEAGAAGDLFSIRLRFPVVGGPGDPTGRYAGYLARVADGGPILVPEGGFNSFRHLFAGDAAAAIESALTTDGVEAGGYNVASAEIVSVRDLVRHLAVLLDRGEPEVVAIPRPLMARWGGEDLFAPFSSCRDQILDPGRAWEALGFRPTPYADWLAETVAAAGGQAEAAGTSGRRPPRESGPAAAAALDARARRRELDLAARYQAALEAA